MELTELIAGIIFVLFIAFLIAGRRYIIKKNIRRTI